MEADWKEQILEFWFVELSPDDWFTGGRDLDERIRSRFSGIYEGLISQTPPEAMLEPQAALAAIIAFDQFPRNMFRGGAKAFASDHLALMLSANALKKGFDRGMTREERQFLAMPLMHSEKLTDQERCVKVFEEIGNDEALKYALEHRDIIEKFGRFPHRNKALNRDTSDAEKAFMQGHEGYGQ